MILIAAPRRRRLVFALVACLAAAFGGLVASTATAGSLATTTGNTPTAIVINRVFSGVTAPSGVPAGSQPYVIVKAGDPFSVEVSFLDAKGRSAFFGEPTTLSISSSVGTLSTTTGLAPKGARTVTLSTSITSPVNQVRLTVSAAGVTPGVAADNQRFDVLSAYKFVDSSAHTALSAGIGGSDGQCADATEADPVCGTLILPNGAGSSQVLMSLGPCDTTYAGCASLRGSIVQVLADLTDVKDLYTKTDPATLVLSCDTTLCGTGAIQEVPVNFSLAGNGPLADAPACPRKGTVGKTQDLCVDYVQSKRDGASDTILYLLFTRDLRGGIG
jgi:hypothetical protein